MSRRMIRWVSSIIVVVFLAVVGVWWYSSTQGLEDQKVSLGARLAAAEQEQVDLEREGTEEQERVAGDAAGVDRSRMDRHEDMVRQVLQTATTWESAEEYNQARHDLMNRMGIPEDSDLLTRVLPEQKCNTTSGGEKICELDSGNTYSEFESLDQHLVKVSGLEYHYFAVVKMKVGAPGTQAEETMSATMTYTVGNDEEIKNLKIRPTEAPVFSSQ